ncbi:unnamed protein product [Paramecium pentaurelia]|uniref:Uncharacterized protein n=1 Tax=Paramecium pentaurelia TaxID=43138 RepID=A0A8S1Y7Q2_9CILI|nr:unnamed protein product [Paramecium pentaurelia]
MTVRPEVIQQVIYSDHYQVIQKLISKNEIRFCLINLQEDNQKILKYINLIEQDNKNQDNIGKVFLIRNIQLKQKQLHHLLKCQYFILLMNIIDKLSKHNYFHGYSRGNW